MSSAYRDAGAVLSKCRQYRYVLWRQWGPVLEPSLVVIGLNPSTADEYADDPTIRRCIGFAKREYLAGLIMLNLFALRATRPRDLLAHPDPIGDANDRFLRNQANPDLHLVVAAWGVHGAHQHRAAEVAAMLPGLKCFGVTKDGHPKHPLYLRADTPIVPFSGAAATPNRNESTTPREQAREAFSKS